MGIHKFFMSLNDLERIIRCPGRFKFEEHNVAPTLGKYLNIRSFLQLLKKIMAQQLIGNHYMKKLLIMIMAKYSSVILKHL